MGIDQKDLRELEAYQKRLLESEFILKEAEKLTKETPGDLHLEDLKKCHLLMMMLVKSIATDGLQVGDVGTILAALQFAFAAGKVSGQEQADESVADMLNDLDLNL